MSSRLWLKLNFLFLSGFLLVVSTLGLKLQTQMGLVAYTDNFSTAKQWELDHKLKTNLSYVVH